MQTPTYVHRRRLLLRAGAAAIRTVLAGAVLAGLFAASRVSYLLFHVVVEVFCLAVGGAIFLIAWNSRRFFRSGYFVVLAAGFVPVAALGAVHMLAYRGMNVLPGAGAQQATQLWIASRYIQSLSLLAAPFFLERTLRLGPPALGFAAAGFAVLLSVFHWRVFPSCFEDGLGLTRFKIVSEYIICGLYLGAGLLLFLRRRRLDANVCALTLGGIGAAAGAELLFTLYAGPFDTANLLGHYLMLASFYLLYRAIVVTALDKPYSLLFRDLKQAEHSLREQRDALEVVVAERTAELSTKNQALQDEIRLREQRQRREDFTRRLLEPFAASTTRAEYLQHVLRTVQSWAGTQCAGIRVVGPDGRAEYEAHAGFSDEFYRQEKCLHPGDRCICVRVLSAGPTEREKSCLTPWGSFRCDDSRAFLGSLAEADLGAYRGACIREGYASLAMIPIRCRQQVLGLIHLADPRPNAISPDCLDYLESVVVLIGEAVHRFNVEDEVRASREKLLSLLQMLPALVSIRSADHTVPFANRQFVRRFGQPDGAPCYRLICGRESPCQDCPVQDVFRTNQPREWERLRRDGRSYYCWGYPYDDDGVRRVLEVSIDITDRKRLENEVLGASENEKRRIGRDLHDSLCQTLSGLTCLTRVLHHRLSERRLGDEATQASQLEEMLAGSVEMARSMARGLTLVDGEQDSLMRWLGELSSNTSKMFRVACRFECDSPVLLDDGLVATHLYRIAQEATHNAVRHGRAKNVCIRLENQPEAVILTVEDDGCGIPPDRPNGEGMGLKVMKYRCDAIGGIFSVGPRQDGGTVVSCRLARPAQAPKKE